ncbi:DUF914-domain-containing protein [Daedalea quercina L-15889]|uniref:DUF914-domain-containing protein n=1 Tax=Daedalea quercina L-15889 TaxID=1314783 RepID=A0A165MFJ3_9APHY|nr:DUF914-domain-containing protein [Daedalea quercina L-15889]
MSSADAFGPQLSRGDSKKDYADISDPAEVSPPTLVSQSGVQDVVIEARPPLDYSSPRAFCRSLWRRFCSIWTKRFILSLFAGQLVSLCITCTNVTTTELVDRNWSLPTTQTWFLYFSLFTVYTPYTIYQYGFKGWLKMILRDGWKYIILAACDVEGNFLAVKAYNYTTLLSCELLDAWAIPSCLFFSWVYMRTRYRPSQLLGVLVCVGGLGMLVASDELTDKDWAAPNRGLGDAYMVIGATLYGFTNATEEFFVRRSPLYEVVGQLGMWGMIINAIQAAGLEHQAIREATWSGMNIGLLVAYTASMFILYTVAPMLYRMASSAYYNLSILSSDFYGLLFGLFLFHYRPFWLYFPAFAVVILGLVIYFWSASPEAQGKIEPRVPTYIERQRETVNIVAGQV